jgi:GMP synthase-like glutamine amidotransferase
MRVHVFQHVPFEDLGNIRPWLENRGAQLTYTRFFAAELPPVNGDIDMLIAMGGPMSVNDERAFPWLKAEKQAVREVIAENKPVLGVCLGAQLIASALGARVYRNPAKEIGWFTIQGVYGGASAFSFPRECTVFHWHGETFDLPAGAVHLARSEACEHQAFQIKRNVIGLQFHLEMTANGLKAIVENCRGELNSERYIQPEADLLNVSISQISAANGLMDEILTYLIDGQVNKA